MAGDWNGPTLAIYQGVSKAIKNLASAVLLAVPLLLTGCAGGNRAGIQFDASVPSNQKAMIEDDLNFLASVQMPTPSSANELAYIGVGDLSAESMYYFLSQRIKYIVGESFNYQSKTQKVARTDSGGTTMFASLQTQPLEANDDIKIVMLNLGGGLYLDGKDTGSLYYINLASQPMIPVSSPRVGILKVGEGLFTVNSIKGVPLDATSNRLLRIATYFHESRHSDGNGGNAAFPHATCTSGTYADEAACENNINGPYAIQVMLLNYFYSVCQARACSSTEMAGLAAQIADYKTRLIGSTYSDPRPEKFQ